MEVVVPESLRSGERFDSLLGNEGQDDGNRMDTTPDAEGPLKRQGAEYERSYARFVVKNRNYTHQYSHVYQKRLAKLRPVIEEQAKLRWENVPIIEKVIALQTNQPDHVVIGTLYKEQKLKPSVLDEFVDEFSSKAKTKELDNYCDDEDKLMLEDQSGRMELEGLDTRAVDSLLTGVIIGVKGRLNENGEFVVQDYCFAGFPPGAAASCNSSSQMEEESSNSSSSKKYLVLASDLGIGGDTDPMKTQLLVDYVAGYLGSDADQKLESEISRLIIAGGSVKQAAKENDPNNTTTTKKLNSKKINAFVEPVKQLDYSLTQLSSTIPVDIMPGASDPCNITLPQQPLHRCLFPNAERFKQDTFHRVTNPYEFKYSQRTILGHSGQPLHDMLKYSRGKTPIELMQQCIMWRHVAPTAPDTLPCYPLTISDPFVIETLPDVFFVGGMDEFDTKLVTGGDGQRCRLVTIPSFAKTGIVVLLDLSSLDVSTIQFDEF